LPCVISSAKGGSGIRSGSRETQQRSFGGNDRLADCGRYPHQLWPGLHPPWNICTDPGLQITRMQRLLPALSIAGETLRCSLLPWYARWKRNRPKASARRCTVDWLRAAKRSGKTIMSFPQPIGAHQSPCPVEVIRDYTHSLESNQSACTSFILTGHFPSTIMSRIRPHKD